MDDFEPSLIAADAAERTRFLDALRDTGSVRAAARATGASVTTLYRLRRRDRGFADAWDAVTGNATSAALEAAMLARATHGVERYKFLGGGGVEIWRQFDEKLAWNLLQKRLPATYGPLAGTAAAGPRRVMSRKDFIAAIEARPRLDAPLPESGGPV